MSCTGEQEPKEWFTVSRTVIHGYFFTVFCRMFNHAFLRSCFENRSEVEYRCIVCGHTRDLETIEIPPEHRRPWSELEIREVQV